MAAIVPTVTAENSHVYRDQLERIAPFATRVHLDFMDGLFAPNTSLGLKEAWAPEHAHVDLHLMYFRPDLYLDHVQALKPQLVIVHAEAHVSLGDFIPKLKDLGCKVGVAVLQKTPIESIKDQIESIDHVLVFSGDLGHFGGKADLSLLTKVKQLKDMKPELEIGWDGGIDDKNAKQLVDGGVDILNVGGFIQRSEDPAAAFRKLRNSLA